MSRKKALLGVVTPLAALVIAGLFVTFDAPGLGREVEESVRSATGVRLEISRSRFGLLRGLLLSDVRASAGGYDVRIPRLTLEHRLTGLLRGRRDLTGVRLEETRIGAVSIESLELNLARLEYDSRAITPLHGIRVEGVLGARRVVFDTRELSELTSSVAAEGGRFRFEGLRASTVRGDLAGDLALDFNSLPFRWRGSLVGPAFSIGGLGPGLLRLDMDGFGTRARNAKGRGSLRLERGRIPDASWIREIDPSLVGLEHAQVEIPFEIRDARVYIARVELDAGGRVVAIGGSIGLDGSRDLRVF